MKVYTHISGSFCVVYRTQEHYIDCRKDTRYPHLVSIECVRNGRVYRRDRVGLCDAPKETMRYVREEFFGWRRNAT